MPYPILFYGICLGNLPSENLDLPASVLSDSDWVRISELESLANQHGLLLLSSLDRIDHAELDCVHLGIEIHHSKYVLNRTQSYSPYEFPSFPLDLIQRVSQNPSAVINALRQIGITALPNDLRLYGTCGTD